MSMIIETKTFHFVECTHNNDAECDCCAICYFDGFCGNRMQTFVFPCTKFTRDDEKNGYWVADIKRGGNQLYTKEEVQKLIDICFAIGLTMSDSGNDFSNLTQEEKADYIRESLSICGFPTQAIGMSWGVLQ